MKPSAVGVKGMYADSIPSTSYLTHGFDSYPAKMIPHMARFLIEEVTMPGDVVLDPFCGSGAVLIEASVAGRRAVGIDLNPLAVLYARAKLSPLDPRELSAQLAQLCTRFGACNNPFELRFPNADYWFTCATLRKLGVIRRVLCELEDEWHADAIEFWRAVLAAVVRDCSRADPRSPKPFISKRAREKRVGRHFDPFRYFERKGASHIAALGALHSIIAPIAGQVKRPQVLHGDSRDIAALVDGTGFDAVVTSPPYLSAQDYYRSSKLELLVLGLSSPEELRQLSREFVGSDRITTTAELLDSRLTSPIANNTLQRLARQDRKRACVFAKCIRDTQMVLHGLFAALRADGRCAIVTGENLVCGLRIRMPAIVKEQAESVGFTYERCFSDRIRDRWVPTVRNGHRGVIDEEHMLLFRRPE